MQLTRRDFLRFCGVSAAALGLSAVDLSHLEQVLANPSAPSVLWLQGAGCTGCSVSFLNRISTTDPTDAADILLNHINLEYHPNIMSIAGQSAVNILETAYNRGGYILAVEGGVPTAFGGATCFAYTNNGVEVTFQQAVASLAFRASKVVCIGTCASWGGMSAAPPNPTRVKGVKDAVNISTINVAGCPPHPDWVVWVIVQLLLGNTIPLDTDGRPTQFYASTIHSHCPREDGGKATTFGQDNLCLRELGCRGPKCKANCQSVLWNNRQNWCIDANALCIGCTEPTFPSATSFRQKV